MSMSQASQNTDDAYKIVVRNGKEYRYPKARYTKRKEAAPIAKPKPVRAGRTVGQLVDDYQNSIAWRNLSERSRVIYTHNCKRLKTIWRDEPAVGLRKQHVETAYLAVADECGYGAAKMFLMMLRIVVGHAISNGYLAADPSRGIKTKKSTPWPAMPQETFQELMAKLPAWLARALWLAALLGQRRSDVAALKWKHWTGTRFVFVQQKNKSRNPSEVSIPVPQECIPIIEAMRDGRGPEDTIVVGHNGQPMTAENLSDALRHRVRLPNGMNFHSLRKLRLTELALAGASTFELMSVSGHRSAASLKPYIDMANKATYADSAIQKSTSGLFSSVMKKL